MTETVTPETEHLRKDAAENRNRILQAAAEVFAARGVEASVDDIARAASVGIGTLYRRFPNKEALIAELVGELLTELLWESKLALGAPNGEGLEQYLYRSAKLQVKHRGCLSRLYVDGHSELITEVRRNLSDLLSDAQAHGKIRNDVTVADIYVLSWSFKGVIDLTQAIAPSAWQRHLDILLAGLRPSEQKLSHAPISDRQLKAIRARRQGR